MISLVGSNQHESIFREENKTRAGGFGQRTDKLQRQERNDQEQKVRQKSTNIKGLISFWQSEVLSSGKDSSQNVGASELPKTDSATINHLQNVSGTGWAQDHRLKKACSMNSLLGSNQHEPTFREENKTGAGGFGHRTDRLHSQERNDSENQVQQKSANFKELLSLWQSGVLSSGKDNSRNMRTSELLKTDSTTINQLQNVYGTGWPQDHRLKKAYSMDSLLGSKQHESIFSRLHITSYFS